MFHAYADSFVLVTAQISVDGLILAPPDHLLLRFSLRTT